MYRSLALVRASWRSAASYRLRFILSFASLVASIVPLYFIANALQSTMANAIQGEGSQYFAFLVLGTVSLLLVGAAVNSLPGEIGSGINTGVLDALLGTPSRLPSIIGGLIGYGLLWTVVRGAVLVAAAWVLGADVLWSQAFTALVILALIIAAHLPLGMMSAALVIAFRTPGPLPKLVMAGSALLGGVYYPTSVVPSWLQHVSDLVPLSYGLRALRGALLEGVPVSGLLPDLAALVLFTVVLAAVGTLTLMSAFTYARRAGTLAHY